MDENSQRSLDKAKQLHLAGESSQAKDIYQRLLADDPENPDALHFLGLLHYQDNDVYSAVELISKCINVQPDYADAYLNLGNILLKLNEVKEAYACYAKAHELEPERYETLTNFGLLLRHAGDLAQSRQLLQKACDVQPQFAIGHYNLAITQIALGQLKEALLSLELCMQQKEPFEPAYPAYAKVCYRAGQPGKAAAVYRLRLKDKPGDPSLEHMLAAVTGENVPVRASAHYTQALFDQHALTFEQNLTHLNYRTPQHLEPILAQLLSAQSTLNVLDACCGTGFCAPYLRAYARQLTGVDLSAGMLGQAREKGQYDELVCADLTDFLNDKADSFDLIVSADALIYFGDLREVIALCARALSKAGVFVFTLEQTTDATPAPNGFALAPHGRYVHTHAYVTTLLNACELDVQQVSACVLREELGNEVNGWMCVATKP